MSAENNSTESTPELKPEDQIKQLEEIIPELKERLKNAGLALDLAKSTPDYSLQLREYLEAHKAVLHVYTKMSELMSIKTMNEILKKT